MNSAASVSRLPAIARLFLMAIGTPANGRGSPGPMASAPASASSAKTSTNALSDGSSSAIRFSDASTSSRADRSPARTSAASSWTGRNSRSAPAAVDIGATYLPADDGDQVRNPMARYHVVMQDRDLPDELSLP